MSYPGHILTDEQLELELLGLLARICVLNGHKVVASALNMSSSNLSHALSRHKNASIRSERLGKVVCLEGGADFVALLARCCGHELIVTVPPSALERCVAMAEAARQQLGGELHKGFLRAVDRRIAVNRGLAKALAEGGE